MGFYEAFFNPEDTDRPYGSEKEAVAEVLALVDVFLNIAAWGRDEVQERLDMRGVVITPQEFRMALEDRMFKNEEELGQLRQFEEMSRAEARQAWKHVEGRLRRSREAGKEPGIGALASKNGLDRQETFCFYLAAAVEYDRKYERIYGYLQDNVAAKLPTVGLGLSLTAMLEAAMTGTGKPAAIEQAMPETGKPAAAEQGEGMYGRFMNREKSPLWQVLLAESSGEENVSRLSCPMRLKQPVLEVLMGSSTVDEFVSRQKQELPKRQGSLGGCAFPVRLGYEWEDLVLEAPQKDLLRHICDRVHYRRVVMEDWGFARKSLYGNGISAVFYGSPGTGKTMAAQVLAGELGLELYKIDLSQLVSKYIGETEKNLGEVFDEARRRNIILFFDEADALFARRSEVGSSNDRYANMETGYLLQKLEEYEGITILATNFINNLDDAFKRRIRFFVRFPFPDPDMRLRLWKKMIPEQARIEEKLELERWAGKFELTGSDIREIVTSSAYLAAADGRGIRNEDVLEALRLYYRKLGKRMTKEEL